MGDSSKIMGKISALTNIKEIAAITTNMQTNLTKLGIMGEMVEDAMDDMDDDMVGDDAAVDKLLNEVQDKVDPEKVKARGGAMQQAEEEDDLDGMLNDLKN
jgi:division protein CdvB (Snf7/Vps24/ESCRT-III family)